MLVKIIAIYYENIQENIDKTCFTHKTISPWIYGIGMGIYYYTVIILAEWYYSYLVFMPKTSQKNKIADVAFIVFLFYFN
jgi:hypothetical protein